MRPIGTLETEAAARLFGDYLYAQGVRNDVDSDGAGQWIVWVHDEDQLAEASELLERFKARKSDDEFRSVASKAGEVRAAEEEDHKKWQKRFRSRRQLWAGAGGVIERAGVVTWVLIIICLCVGYYSKLGKQGGFTDHFYIEGVQTFVGKQIGLKSSLAEIRSGQIWRVFTPMLLHFTLMHLLFNMMWLHRLGGMVEHHQSSWHLIALVMLFAAGSNFVQYAFDEHPFFGGFSGVNYGLFGYVWIRGRYDPSSRFVLDPRDVILMIVWFLVCFTGWVGPVANAAHGAGFAMGMLWGRVSAGIRNG